MVARFHPSGGLGPLGRRTEDDWHLWARRRAPDAAHRHAALGRRRPGVVTGRRIAPAWAQLGDPARRKRSTATPVGGSTQGVGDGIARRIACRLHRQQVALRFRGRRYRPSRSVRGMGRVSTVVARQRSDSVRPECVPRLGPSPASRPGCRDRIGDVVGRMGGIRVALAHRFLAKGTADPLLADQRRGRRP